MKGLSHADVGDEITKNEWESDSLHILSDGTAFPETPTERDQFYRTDLHKWYVYNGTDWRTMVG